MCSLSSPFLGLRPSLPVNPNKKMGVTILAKSIMETELLFTSVERRGGPGFKSS